MAFESTDTPPWLSIGEWINDTRKHVPDNIAVVFGDTSITYAELSTLSDRLANDIIANYPDESIIGVSTTRSIAMIVYVVGVLKAGRFYLPIDLSHPEDRIKQVINDAGLRVVACDDNEKDRFLTLGIPSFCSYDTDSERTQPAVAAPGTGGYVLYTSGSTGVPKGVQMGEAALLNLLVWQQRMSSAGRDSKTLQFAPLTFDVSFQEIFSTLTTGGTLVMVDDDLRLNPLALLEFIQEESINRLFLPFVALQMLADTANFSSIFPVCIHEVMTAGEQLKITPQIRRFFTEIPSAALFNQYGPTEAHVVSALTLAGDARQWPELPSIGVPIANTNLFVVNEQFEPLPNGQAGELFISGTCLAMGYLNKPDLTAERFFDWVHPEKGNLRVYRSGDLAKIAADGEIEFLGRIDHQVKIRGHRVELGEIESLLTQQPTVKDAVVTATGSGADDRKLIAYVILEEQGSFDAVALQRAVRLKLPEYMIPSAVVHLEAFPKTSSGKVDRKALPIPVIARPELDVLYTAPKSAQQKQLATLWKELLNIDRIGINDNFFELGGNSLLAQKTVITLKQRHGIDLPITKLYQHGTVADIVSYLETHGNHQGTVNTIRMKERKANDAPVAVVGFAGRFPGAGDVWELWDVLVAGKETTHFFSPEELDATITSEERNDPNYVAARGITDTAEWFDEKLFGLSPIIATLMDPQQRVFLEICRDALESTGHLPAVFPGTVGVYAGSGNNTYYLHNVLTNPKAIDKVGAFQALTLNEKDYIASRVAYQLDLKGPAVSVFSACSTSLLAIAQAVDGLRNGHCDVALAGGVAIKSPIHSGHIYEEGAMFSKDGHCRPFDIEAQGTVFSDGAGVVVLKKLSDAEKDGDSIYAVIKGIGINNDGGNKGSFTAPNPSGQASAIAMALADANVDPSTMGYIEAHGTATPLGDPIEIEGLKMAFGPQPSKQYCRIGSIKSNMGHLTHAAGVAGFIKTALSLHFRLIPPSINYKAPNPAIDFANSPFVVNDQLTPWESETARRAGISSFGVGGTNVHIILEEAPVQPKQLPQTGVPPYLVNWSAATEAAAASYAEKLIAFLKNDPGIDLGAITTTLNKTQQPLKFRNYIVAADRMDLLAKLKEKSWKRNQLTENVEDIIFMFPGQGAQYPYMGKELYDRFEAYRNAVDTCATILSDTMHEDIREVVFSGDPDKLRNTHYTQPAIFVTEYALAKLWMSWGIQPAAFIGHSVGEFVAACLAGVFTLSDALLLVATRGRLISALPGGSMASIRDSLANIDPILPQGLSIAANNAPNLCVVSGPDELVAGFVQQLTAAGIKTSLLHTSHAFHSSMMDPMLAEFGSVVGGVKKQIPQKPVISTVTGTWLTDTQAISDNYWVRHVRETVDFSSAIGFVAAEMDGLLLEVGPGPVTATLAKQHPAVNASRVIGGIRATESTTELHALYEALGKLWALGPLPDWTAMYANHSLLPTLPTYAYDRNYHWLTAPTAPAGGVPTPEINEPSISSHHQNNAPMRKQSIISKVRDILDEASGITIDDTATHDNFIEIGLDSLLLTQVAQTLKKEFNLPITFRKLNEEYYSLDLLATYLDQHLPADQFAAAQPVNGATHTPSTANHLQAQYIPAPSYAANDSIALISQQISLISQQIALLQGVQAPTPQMAATPAAPVGVPSPTVANTTVAELSKEEAAELKKPFGATARIDKQVTTLTEKQRSYLDGLMAKYVDKTLKSKAYTQTHRAYMADPRVVSGFKPLTKEITYALVVNRSSGCHLWDIDGNEYVDALNGFGSSMFGNQPEVIKEALLQQIEEGYEIGPQHEKSGEVCKLICEFTGMDRAGLCNTGSEAVLGAMRIARTVTGRSTIVAFTNSYHGIVDEVIVRGSKRMKSFPAAPGIMPEAVQNMLILDYGTEESLRIIRERAHELAAVLVEPIQSRRPEFAPVEFLKEVRKITEESGSALIFDEVISGFRFHPKGAQGLFGISADIGTYGKVAGAGISIGIIAGKKRFMDALDGGFWQFGDDSTPESGVTYFAGTFVRHPLALATTKASLEYLKAQGPELQERLNRNTDYLAQKMNAVAKRFGTPIYVAHCCSLWKIKYHEEYPYSELLFTLMRYKGIHIQDGFPCFLTTAHTEADIDAIASAFEESIAELTEAGFIPTKAQANTPSFNPDTPPLPNARLGKDLDGNPAWFVEDNEKPGQFLKVTSQ
ncbi:amino acid adenylation domain-containing protein [Parapedobacter sp. 2B3]|uniref:amino acid adenylation domain-containing protein n=1 Tax=Parapedobacter sp. 2B3 TaxID=3342381 RepID=UPI0035B59449